MAYSLTLKKYTKSAFFESDISQLTIDKRIHSVLVIGGAGTIGSSYIKHLLQLYQPKRVVVVDINENGLTELTRDLRSSN
ncbi:MAG: hypothetical protein RIR51_1650, partial [Bacteroidota bacterium]